MRMRGGSNINIYLLVHWEVKMLIVDYDKGTVSDKFVELYDHLHNLSAHHFRLLQSIYLWYILCVIQMQRVYYKNTYISNVIRYVVI